MKHGDIPTINAVMKGQAQHIAYWQGQQAVIGKAMRARASSYACQRSWSMAKTLSMTSVADVGINGCAVT